ncbi:hypothetical protein E8E11_004911 [Didymella keratinophila]|nr:hypothetical protein E8E11_004911 [Didymella keratinophila]
MPFFQLIDCTSRLIFTPSSTPEYLALSYVWGSTTPKTVGNGKGILYDVPGVIEDAIQMTLRLGYKYLWIDQFCIYQGDPEKKVQQIAAMDLVYESAQITLVALYDPETGMPGAGRTHRVPQPRLELEDGSAYASTMQNPRYEINASVWMTRGWTFQEGLYSRRRLFFTKHQVFMECHSLTYSEIVEESHEVVMQTDGKPTSFRVFPCRSIQSTLSAEPWTIIDRLSKYTDRNLTFESDMVNGILSMFRVFHKSGHGESRAVTHLWGVPILYSPDKEWTQEYGLVTGLCWRIHGVVPKHSDTPRRSGFPSWSWAGWRAHVWADSKIYQVGFKPPLEIHVAVELPDGSVLALGDYERIVANAGRVGKSGEIPSLSPFLHLEAWTIPVRVLYEPQKSHSWHVVIDHEEEPVTCWLQLHGNDKSNARNASRLHGKVLDAIIIGNIVTHEDEQTYNDPWLIVVEKGQVEGTVEKIGFVDLDDPLGVGPKTHARYMQHEAPRDMFKELPRLFAGRKRQKLRLA